RAIRCGTAGCSRQSMIDRARSARYGIQEASVHDVGSSSVSIRSLVSCVEKWLGDPVACGLAAVPIFLASLPDAGYARRIEYIMKPTQRWLLSRPRTLRVMCRRNAGYSADSIARSSRNRISSSLPRERDYETHLAMA